MVRRGSGIGGKWGKSMVLGVEGKGVVLVLDWRGEGGGVDSSHCSVGSKSGTFMST